MLDTVLRDDICNIVIVLICFLRETSHHVRLGPYSYRGHCLVKLHVSILSTGHSTMKQFSRFPSHCHLLCFNHKISSQSGWHRLHLPRHSLLHLPNLLLLLLISDKLSKSSLTPSSCRIRNAFNLWFISQDSNQIGLLIYVRRHR